MVKLRNILLVVTAAAVLIVGYTMLLPDPEPEASSRRSHKVFHLTMNDLNATASTPTFHAIQGDHVTLFVIALNDGVLSIHGYNKELRLSANQKASLEFVADHAGRYPVHVHGKDGSHTELATLNVDPRLMSPTSRKASR